MLKNNQNPIKYDHPLLEPESNRDLDVLSLKSKDEVPQDIFACCMDSNLCKQAISYMAEFNVSDYRVFVATDSRYRKHVENILNK